MGNQRWQLALGSLIAIGALHAGRDRQSPTRTFVGITNHLLVDWSYGKPAPVPSWWIIRCGKALAPERTISG